MSAPTYRAWALNEDGDLSQFCGLTRSRAIWRDHWHTRMSGRLRLTKWGWDREEDAPQSTHAAMLRAARDAGRLIIVKG